MDQSRLFGRARLFISDCVDLLPQLGHAIIFGQLPQLLMFTPLCILVVRLCGLYHCRHLPLLDSRDVPSGSTGSDCGAEAALPAGKYNWISPEVLETE